MSYLYGLSLESFFEPLESDSVGEIVSCPESEKDRDKNNVLTLTVLITTAVLISLRFHVNLLPENDSHKMPSLIFSEK